MYEKLKEKIKNLGDLITTFVNKNEENKETSKETTEIKNSKIKLAKINSIDKYEIEVNEDKFEVGTILTQNQYGDDGTVVSTNHLNDGEYELEDGTKIQVDSNGVIVLNTPVKLAEDENPKDENPKDETKIEDLVMQLVDAVSALNERLTKIEEEISKNTSKEKEVKEELTKLSKEIEEIGKKNIPSFQDKIALKTNAVKSHNEILLEKMKTMNPRG